MTGTPGVGDLTDVEFTGQPGIAERKDAVPGWVLLRADPDGDAGAGISARVVRRRPAGTRVIASLEGDDGSRAEVELPTREDVQPGARMWVGLPDTPQPRWVVAGEEPAVTGPLGPVIDQCRRPVTRRKVVPEVDGESARAVTPARGRGGRGCSRKAS